MLEICVNIVNIPKEYDIQFTTKISGIYHDTVYQNDADFIFFLFQIHVIISCPDCYAPDNLPTSSLFTPAFPFFDSFFCNNICDNF